MTITPKAIKEITDEIGEVQTNPTANTVLDRLKRITTETLATAQTHESLGGFWPEPGTLTTVTSIGQPTDFKIDSRGNMSIRGPITTDEGSLREDFPGTTIYRVISGTITFTTNSNIVTAVGTTFTDGKVQYADYIKLSTDPDIDYAKITSVISDTELLLENVYTGSTGVGIGHHSKFVPITGNGGAVSVASSICTIISGTVSGSITRIIRDIDYGPLVVVVAYATIPNRRANQTGYIGLTDDALAPTISAYFQFDATDNKKLKAVTQFSAQETDIETTNITILVGTDTKKRYKIELAQEYVDFYIDDILVATHINHIPSPYSYMQFIGGWINAAAVVTSSMFIDTIFIGNIDVLQVMSGMGNLPVIIDNPPISPAFTTTSEFEMSLTITRAANTTQYAVGDIVNSLDNSTLPQFNFSALGDLNYRFVEIYSVVIISNNGAAASNIAPFIHLFNVSLIPGLTLTDHSPFNPSFTDMMYYRVLSINPSFTSIDTGDNCYLLTLKDKARSIKLSSSSRLFLALVNSTEYIPIAGETIRVILKGTI